MCAAGNGRVRLASNYNEDNELSQVGTPHALIFAIGVAISAAYQGF